MANLDVTTVEESEYKGKPILSLPTPGKAKFPFSFGLAKARLILAHIDEIDSFVTKHEGQAGE